MPSWAEENLRKGDLLRGTLEAEAGDMEVSIVADPASREVLGIDDTGRVIARVKGISEMYAQRKVQQKEREPEKSTKQAFTGDLQNKEPDY